GGRFPTTVSRSAEPGYPRAIATADTGGDGVDDVAVFYKAFPDDPDTAVFPGSAERNRPRHPSLHPLQGTAVAALADDIDGDGDPDLAALTGDRRIRLLVNRPGPYQMEHSRAYGEAAETDRFAADLVSGDFDADGDADLAVADPGEARVFLFTGDTRPKMAASYRFPNHARPQTLAATDLDGDGLDDLVVLRQGPDGPVLTGLQVKRESDNLTFTNRGDYRDTELVEANRLRLTDLDETGGPDAVVWGRSGDGPGLATVRDLNLTEAKP
ncbi:MAG: FG-GAP-like repeat-containing protein, partial [Thiohalorhabdaceae bacterium]